MFLTLPAPRQPLPFLSFVSLLSGYTRAQKPPVKLEAFHCEGVQRIQQIKGMLWLSMASAPEAC